MPRYSKTHAVRRLFVILLVLILAASVWNYMRPLPMVAPGQTYAKSYAPTPVILNWPAFGEAALGTTDGAVLGSNGTQSQLATASIAKVITSLCILQKYPLAAGQSGPSVTMTENDVALYNKYLAADGSVVAVQAGEQLTERQLLEAMMLPSANNIADTTAIWAFGSLDAYFTYANQFLQANGLTSTKVGVDASGYDGATVSTAVDLTKLGVLAVKQPALAAVIREPSTNLPLVGTVTNYNTMLGTDGIIGVKTGNNDTDLGAFLFAAQVSAGNSTQTIVGAVMGAGSLNQAMRSSLPLINTAAAGYEQLTPVRSGQPVGIYTAPWGAKATAVAADTQILVRWRANEIRVSTKLPRLAAGQSKLAGASVNVVSGTSTSVAVKLQQPLSGPSFWWRVTRH